MVYGGAGVGSAVIAPSLEKLIDIAGLETALKVLCGFRVGHLSASRVLLEAANGCSPSRFEDAMASHALAHFEFLLTMYDQAAGPKS